MADLLQKDKILRRLARSPYNQNISVSSAEKQIGI
jgi:hypothetical protein